MRIGDVDMFNFLNLVSWRVIKSNMFVGLWCDIFYLFVSLGLWQCSVPPTLWIGVSPANVPSAVIGSRSGYCGHQGLGWRVVYGCPVVYGKRLNNGRNNTIIFLVYFCFDRVASSLIFFVLEFFLNKYLI